MRCSVTDNFFRRLATIPLILLLLLAARTGWATDWIRLPGGSGSSTTALCTLVKGDDTWVGYEFGLTLYQNSIPIYVCTPKEGLPGSAVVDLAVREDELWAATSGGLFRIEFGKSNGAFPESDTLIDLGKKVYTTDQGLPDTALTSVTVSGKDVYVGTLKGLAKIIGDSCLVFDEEKGMPDNHVTTLAPYTRGVLVGTTNGWAIVQGDKVESHPALLDGLTTPWVTAICHYKVEREFNLSPDLPSSDEGILIGTAGGGLYIYKAGTYKPFPHSEKELASQWITALAYDQPNKILWIGTKEGISICDLEKITWEQIDPQQTMLASTEINDLSIQVEGTRIKTLEIEAASGVPPLYGDACSCATCTFLIAKPNPRVICPHCTGLQPRLVNGDFPVLKTWAGIATTKGAYHYFSVTKPRIAQACFKSYSYNVPAEEDGYILGFANAEALFFTVPIGPGYIPIPGREDRVGGGAALGGEGTNLLLVGRWPREPTRPNVVTSLTLSPRGGPVAGGARTPMYDGGLEFWVGAGMWRPVGKSDGMTDHNVTALYRGRDYLLIGTGGFSNQDGSIWKYQAGRIESMPTKGLNTMFSIPRFPTPVTCLCSDDRRVYVGTKDSGIFILEGDTWTRLHTFSRNGPSDDGIKCLTVRHGILYVGTKKGLDCLGEGRKVHLDISQAGAYSNEVRSLLWDESEGSNQMMVLWVGHQEGLMRISLPEGVMVDGGTSPRQAHAEIIWPTMPDVSSEVVCWSWPANPNQYRFDVCGLDGPPGHRVNCLYSDDLYLWIGTDNGVARFSK